MAWESTGLFYKHHFIFECIYARQNITSASVFTNNRQRNIQTASQLASQLTTQTYELNAMQTENDALLDKATTCFKHSGTLYSIATWLEGEYIYIVGYIVE